MVVMQYDQVCNRITHGNKRKRGQMPSLAKKGWRPFLRLMTIELSLEENMEINQMEKFGTFGRMRRRKQEEQAEIGTQQDLFLKSVGELRDIQERYFLLLWNRLYGMNWRRGDRGGKTNQRAIALACMGRRKELSSTVTLQTGRKKYV